MKTFLIILSLSFVIATLGRDYPDSGFTNKAEAKNLTVNGLKEGKWVEYYYTVHGLPADTDRGFYCLTIYHNGKTYRSIKNVLF